MLSLRLAYYCGQVYTMETDQNVFVVVQLYEINVDPQ